MTVLVTGGAGYIGSHTCVELLNAGYAVTVADNLVNSNRESVSRIEKITGKKIKFYEADIRDKNALRNIFKENKIEAVLHFAGLKAAGESVKKPLEYYENNVGGTLSLISVMKEYGCKRMVFSSSAMVYDTENGMPLKEGMPLKAANPYGRTKLTIEEMLKDIYAFDNEWSVALLRYFNPIGAHKSGLIGEDPKGIPNNLMPYISQVAAGKLEKLSVFGNDYPTPDGTGVRDYIHVVDLAKGHLKALDLIFNADVCEEINLGTGMGTSVLELKDAFEKTNGIKIPFVIAPRRQGDVAVLCADVSKAERLLGWKTELDINDMCRDTWNWQKNNPDGYNS